MGIYRRTKIICTLGPASDSKEMIVSLAKSGMNVVRLNFSHSDHAYYREKIKLVHDISEEINIPLGVMLDTKGPEIRCGTMENGEVMFSKGDVVEITNDEVIGTNKCFQINCTELYDDIRINDYLLIDDGKMRLTVIDRNGKNLICRVENPGVIKTRKGVNVPNVHISLPFISEKDDADIRFGCEMDVDYIAASFVRTAEDILAIRRILIEEGKPKMFILAKIENQEGYDNLDSILKVADGIMVARGDLGVEVVPEVVPIYQKKMIQKANEYGKPVVTATHMLESMLGNPRPTRAEVSDVANAVLDGTDAIMLSGETASGMYPLEAVQTMDAIAKTMEDIFPYRENLDRAKKTTEMTIQDAIGISVCDSVLTLDNVKAIVVFTQSGSTAYRVAKFRPPVPILAMTFNKHTQRRMQMPWGVIPIFSKVENDMVNDDELASEVAKLYGVKKGEFVIITAGYPAGEGATNMMKIIEVK